MEVHLRPETESRLQDFAAQTGRAPDDLVEDAMVGYLQELSVVRSMRDRRYDDLKSRRVKPVDGEQALRHSEAKERRTPAFMKKLVLHPEVDSDLIEVWEYVAADNINAADRVLDEFIRQ